MAGHPLADWLDGDDVRVGDDAEDESPPQGNRRRLMLLGGAAVVVWVAVMLVVGLVGRGGDDAEAPSHETGAAGGDSQPVEPGPVDAGGPEAEAAPPSGEAPPADVAATAVVGARLEVSRLGENGGARYVDVAVAERGERLGDLWVVTVLAVVLDGDGEAWTDSTVARFAVPVATGPNGERALAGAPWALPGPSPASGVEGQAWETDEEAAPGVAEALEEAGFADVTDLVTARGDEPGIVLASFTAQDPSGHHEVWLAEEPEPRVLGTTARAHQTGE